MSLPSLVRRGAEFASEHFSEEDGQRPEIKVNGWLMGLCAVTSFALLLIFWAVHYTYGLVVATLAAVEDSNPDVYVRIDADADGNKPVDAAEPELASSIPPKPITSKLRTTVKHLRDRAGPWSRFRGMSMALTYGFIKMLLVSILPLRADQFCGQFFADLITEVLLANLRMAWVHIVISEPSPKRFYQRIPGRSQWMKIAPVAALQSAATGAAFYFPLGLVKLFGGWDAFNSSPEVPTAQGIFQLFAIIVLPTLLCFVVAIPARAIFLRVAASMLPEEDEAIVPFDRTFGGKVVPAILGGSGKVSITDAWTTFDWPARVRFLKVVGKVFVIESIIVVGFVFALAGQFFMIGKDSVHALAVAMGDQTA